MFAHTSAFTWAVNCPSSPLILPEEVPYVCQFSQLLPDGTTHSWIWLFAAPIDAVAVRAIAKSGQVTGDLWPIIEATLTQPSCHLRKIPLEWLATVDLKAMDIQEVWWGFDRQKFYRSPTLTSPVVFRLPPESLRRL